MRGIRHRIGSARQGKAPIVAGTLMQMLKHCEGDALIQKRDRALLSLAFCGAFRRSELCALEVSDLIGTPDGYRVLIRRSKTDQLGEGCEIAVSRGTRIRAVAAVQDWLAAAGISEGPLFRAITLGGKMSKTALTPNSFARIIKRHCRKLGIDPAGHSGHSMRAGMITSSAEAGSSIWKIAEVSRHKSIEVLRN
jgi:integrase